MPPTDDAAPASSPDSAPASVPSAPDSSADGGVPDSNAGGAPASNASASADSFDGGLPPGGAPESVAQTPVNAAPNNVVSINVPLQGASPANAPQVIFSYTPGGPVFPIDEQCTMPTITVTATLQNVPPDTAYPPTPVQYAWQVTLEYDGSSCANSMGRHTEHPPISQTTTANTFTIPFTAVRGGNLTISVTVTRGALSLTQTSQNLQVTGTNPSLAALASAAPAVDAFRKLMRLESGLQQFIGPLCPYFSRDRLGGVGLCQLTRPAPTPDQVWSWKANMAGGYALYRAKEADARGYPARVRASQEFRDLVAAFNSSRAHQTPPLPALPVDLPDFTDEQLQRDTLRCFNGHPLDLHEYRVQLAEADKALVVTLNQAGTRGTAAWELVTPQMRNDAYRTATPPVTSGGDPNYVNDVLARSGF